MSIKSNKSENLFNIINIFFMFLTMSIMIYPFLYAIFASLSEANQLMRHTGLLFKPLGLSIDAYLAVYQNRLIRSGYMNTIINLTMFVALSMTLTSLGAYALSRKDFLLRKQIMLGIVFTMFFNGGLIPTYMLIRNLSMSNTRYALIIPMAISAYNLLIMRTYFEGIPDSLIESAKIDGANEFLILIRIMVPISMPVIAVMILFYGVENWNSWFPAFIYLKDRSLWPLQLVLREIVLSSETSALDNMMTGAENVDKKAVGESIKFATIMAATMPILFVYPSLQKHFVKGVMIGAIKG